MQVKKEFYDTYKVETALGGRPHLTLVNFLQYEMMVERIVNRLRTVAMGDIKKCNNLVSEFTCCNEARGIVRMI